MFVHNRDATIYNMVKNKNFQIIKWTNYYLKKCTWCKVCTNKYSRLTRSKLDVRSSGYVYNCVLGRFVPKSFRTQVVSYPGHFVPRSFRTQVVSYPCRFVPKSFRTQVVSYPRYNKGFQRAYKTTMVGLLSIIHYYCSCLSSAICAFGGVF